MNTSWQDAEAEHDIHREQLRAERHARLANRRADRFWPPIAGLLIIGGITLAAAIEGGAIS